MRAGPCCTWEDLDPELHPRLQGDGSMRRVVRAARDWLVAVCELVGISVGAIYGGAVRTGGAPRSGSKWQTMMNGRDS